MTALPKNYEAMTPEQRKLYDETVAKNVAFNEAIAAMHIRNQLALKQLEEDRERAREQYIEGQRVHDINLATNNKFGKVNLGERKCPVCGKTVFIQDKTAWLFKVRYGKGFVYLCSEGCKEKKLQKRAKDKKKGKKK